MAKVLTSVRAKGFESQLTAMGTIVETSTLHEALSVIEDAYKAVEGDSDRIYVTVNIDIAKGDLGRISSKVSSVEDRLSKN